MISNKKMIFYIKIISFIYIIIYLYNNSPLNIFLLISNYNLQLLIFRIILKFRYKIIMRYFGATVKRLICKFEISIYVNRISRMQIFFTYTAVFSHFNIN